jgi:hypothetical protein
MGLFVLRAIALALVLAVNPTSICDAQPPSISNETACYSEMMSLTDCLKQGPSAACRSCSEPFNESAINYTAMTCAEVDRVYCAYAAACLGACACLPEEAGALSCFGSNCNASRDDFFDSYCAADSPCAP